MTNFEKYKEDILYIAYELKNEDNQVISVDKKTGEPDICYNLYCTECLFGKHNEHNQSCLSLFIKWLYEEYREPIILGDFEKEYLRRLQKLGYRYLVRFKNHSGITACDKVFIVNEVRSIKGKFIDDCVIDLPSLKYGDEPLLIADLLGGEENE